MPGLPARGIGAAVNPARFFFGKPPRCRISRPVLGTPGARAGLAAILLIASRGYWPRPLFRISLCRRRIWRRLRQCLFFGAIFAPVARHDPCACKSLPVPPSCLWRQFSWLFGAASSMRPNYGPSRNGSASHACHCVAIARATPSNVLDRALARSFEGILSFAHIAGDQNPSLICSR